MRKFFMQFGDVSKVKLFRSKKTKGSKGYAFIKFDSAATAKTVSDAMNGYFMGIDNLFQKSCQSGNAIRACFYSLGNIRKEK